MKIYNKIKHRIAVFSYSIRAKKAIKRAKKLAELTGKKHYVLNVGGKLLIYTNQSLRMMIKRRVFKKGTTMDTLRKTAIYITSKTKKDDIRRNKNTSKI